MGMRKDCVGLIWDAYKAIGINPKGSYLCELGNQKVKFGKHGTGKKYLSKRGIHHTSIDLNGDNGALPFDLCEPIETLNGKFDVVTNYGTTEHVFNQFSVFNNIHRFLKVGGASVHCVPHTGSWLGHCGHYYTREFFVALATDNGYEMPINNLLVRSDNQVLVCAVMIKRSDTLFDWETSYKMLRRK